MVYNNFTKSGMLLLSSFSLHVDGMTVALPHLQHQKRTRVHPSHPAGMDVYVCAVEAVSRNLAQF